MNSKNPADLVEVYVSIGTAEDAKKEWKGYDGVKSVRLIKRAVRVAGRENVVYCVCVWYTDEARANKPAWRIS